jgi:uncharacterized protein with HEPN domain
MQKDDLVYLGHMLDTARKAFDKTRGKSRLDYDGDENLRLALVHLIQIIGEAARRVSPEGRTSHPEIPWSDIMGMRHKVVHDYLDVDEDIVWEVVTSDLPSLVSALERIVPPEEVGA